MASAANGDLDDDEVAAVQEETSTCPCMPHLLHSGPDLDARYPPLIAPPDEGPVDATDDRRDAVYQHGLGIAEDIRALVAAQGRKRRPDLNQVHYKDEETLAVVEDPRELDWLKHGARNDLTWLKPSVGLIVSSMVADLSLPDCKWPCRSGTGSKSATMVPSRLSKRARSHKFKGSDKGQGAQNPDTGHFGERWTPHLPRRLGLICLTRENGPLVR